MKVFDSVHWFKNHLAPLDDDSAAALMYQVFRQDTLDSIFRDLHQVVTLPIQPHFPCLPAGPLVTHSFASSHAPTDGEILNYDLWLYISNFISAKDVCALAACSRSFCNAFRDAIIMARLTVKVPPARDEGTLRVLHSFVERWPVRRLVYHNCTPDVLPVLRSPLPSLTYLDISNSTSLCSNDIVQSISAFASLRNLRLFNADKAITAASLAALAETAPELTELRINRRSHTGPLRLNGCESVGKLSKLEVLNMGGWTIEDAGLRAVTAGCPSLRKLDIYRCEGLTGAALEGIGRSCKSLTYIDLYLTLSSGDSLQGVGDAALKHLGQCLSLRVLRAVQCNISDEGMAAVAHMPELRTLQVKTNSHITDAGVRCLRNPKLAYLDVAMTEVVGAGPFPPLPSLTRLDICHCEGINTQGVANLAAYYTNLEDLDISETEATTDCLPWLTPLRKLRILRVDSAVITASDVSSILPGVKVASTRDKDDVVM